MSKQTLDFWAHLDQLRGVMLRTAVVIVVFAVAAFIFKNTLFAIVLAPQNADFLTYRFFSKFTPLPDFSVPLINTGLAEQFRIHMKVAFEAGILLASPYIIFVIFKFVSPALYKREKRPMMQVVFWGYFMFVIGVLVSYFLIFPLTFRFLGTYQVSQTVENLISLSSYIDTLTMLCMWFGILFELPLLCWFFGKLGILNAAFMRRYRRHAIILLLILAAIITPTGDIFTLLVVALPLYALYEISIFVVKK
ncbi:MAG: twin-arginine translocase subunit TatC [Paludibacter sp.]|nr:twin-arginine translocase subunit TatC [Paludibacter sp.]